MQSCLGMKGASRWLSPLWARTDEADHFAKMQQQIIQQFKNNAPQRLFSKISVFHLLKFITSAKVSQNLCALSARPKTTTECLWPLVEWNFTSWISTWLWSVNISYYQNFMNIHVFSFFFYVGMYILPIYFIYVKDPVGAFGICLE